MDYEKKYKEALERARELIGKWIGKNKNFYIEDYSYIFPELKESEDERMVKFIKQQLFNIKKTITENYELDTKLTEAIDWLEKQGEKLPVGFYYVNSEGKKFYSDTFKYGDIILHVEKQGEQKPADKVKPGIGQLDYILQSQNGDTVDDTISHVNQHFYRWTIQDAKDGDVLADDCSIFIFRKIGNKTWDDVVDYYVGCDYESKSGIKIPNGVSHYGKINNVYFKPANAEQRDLLFAKMKEAGYEWDAEKKELKKIEQKPAWSEEDEQYLLVCKNALAKYQSTDKWDANIISRWLENRLKSIMH